MFADTYARNYQSFNKDKPYRKEVEMVYRWAEKPKRILDLGCGTANYWKYYPKDTLVFGVEQSPAMVDASKYKRQILCCDTTKMVRAGRFGLVTALFDVINYIPDHSWWKDLPLDKGGYFIFDIWDKDKVKREGFKETMKYADGLWRIITPIDLDDTSVRLRVTLKSPGFCVSEIHTMYFYDKEDILGFCGNEFKVVEVKPTERWQTWYKLQRK